MDDLLYQKVIIQKYALLNEELEEQVDLLIKEQKTVSYENNRFKEKATKHARLLEISLVVFASVIYDQYSGYESLILSGVIMTVISFLESMIMNIPNLEYGKTYP